MQKFFYLQYVQHLRLWFKNLHWWALFISHVKFAPGLQWVLLSKLWLYAENLVKIKGWALFQGYMYFCETNVSLVHKWFANIVTVVWSQFILTSVLVALCTPAGLHWEQHTLDLLCCCYKGCGKKQNHTQWLLHSQYITYWMRKETTHIVVSYSTPFLSFHLSLLMDDEQYWHSRGGWKLVISDAYE